MIKELTCIVCPMGCRLKVELEDGNVINVEGNTCPRGKNYAIDEFTNPQRTVTSTIMCHNKKVLPVKTDRTIPKDKIFECMEIINSHTVHLPVAVGDILIENVFGCNIVATANMDE